MALFDPAAYGKRLRQARESKGMTQFSLAVAIGEQPITVGRDERGVTQSPPLTRIERLSEELGVDARWLLFGDAPSRDVGERPADPPGLVEFLNSPGGALVPPNGRRLLREMLGADDPHGWDAGTWRGMWAAIAHAVD